MLLCYVDHHDKAYDWAERRKLETHPKTGAAQLVEIRETVQEILIPAYVEAPPKMLEKQKLFANWLTRIAWLRRSRGMAKRRSLCRRGNLLRVTDHLPAEAAEALLELATGGKPKARKAVAVRLRTSRRATPFSRDGERRGIHACARFSLGQVDGFPASRAERTR